MRLSATLLLLVVLSLSTAFAQGTTGGTDRATVAASTAVFDAVRSSNGTMPVLFKKTETKDTKAENIHDVIIWRSATVPTGYTIQDPLHVTTDPEMLELPLDLRIAVEGHAAVLMGIDLGFHPRPPFGVARTIVTFTVDGVERQMTYEIRWESTSSTPTVVRVPNAEPAPAVS